MTDPASTTPPARSYDVPGLLDELGTEDYSMSLHSAYWLGVHRAHARMLDREVRYAQTDREHAKYTELRDGRVAQAEEALRDLKAAMAADGAVAPARATSPRTVAEFNCGAHARDYAKTHGYTVEPGEHLLFAVREGTP